MALRSAVSKRKRTHMIRIDESVLIHKFIMTNIQDIIALRIELRCGRELAWLHRSPLPRVFRAISGAAGGKHALTDHLKTAPSARSDSGLLEPRDLSASTIKELHLNFQPTSRTRSKRITTEPDFQCPGFICRGLSAQSCRRARFLRKHAPSFQRAATRFGVFRFIASSHASGGRLNLITSHTERPRPR